MYQYAMEELADRDELLTWFLRAGWTQWEAFTVEPTSGRGYRIWLRRRPSTVSTVARSLELRRRPRERGVSRSC